MWINIEKDMREYGKVSPQFWIGRTGKALRQAGAEAQLVALYLLTNPHANMIGLYYMPLMFIAHETGLGIEGASKGLRCAIEAGFCHYDEASETVWVPEMAAHQIGANLNPKDKRCPGVQNEYNAQPENPFLSAFYDKYQAHYHMKTRREGSQKKPGCTEGASKGLGSQEQEQEQEQEHKNILGHGDARPPNEKNDLPVNNKNPYTHDFEEAWKIYPRRAGGNSKAEAFKSWKARIKSGVEVRDLLAGVQRYAAFVTATGKINTEFVKQAVTFFGPAGHYAESWTLPANNTGNTQHADTSGESVAVRQIREAFERMEQQNEGHEFMGGDGPDLRPAMDCEEWYRS